MAWQFPVSTNTGIDLKAADSVYVAEGILVGTSTGFAMVGTGTSHRVEVHGIVASGLDAIALMPALNSATDNSVYVGSHGHVVSKGGAGVGFYGGGAALTNDGEIAAAKWGVLTWTKDVTEANVIQNHGTIMGDQFGISAWSNAGCVTRLTNTGLISGTTAAYSQGFGDTALGQDIIVNKGKMIGAVILDGGNDIYDGRLGTVAGTVTAGDGNDTVYGGNEKNTFDGGAGNDRLYGAGGADMLTGGADADMFIFAKTTDSGTAATARDTITDFVESSDAIDLHIMDANTKVAGNQAFKFIAGNAFHHTADELRFQQISGNTYVSGDVDGDAKADFSIKLAGLHTLSATDFVL